MINKPIKLTTCQSLFSDKSTLKVLANLGMTGTANNTPEMIANQRLVSVTGKGAVCEKGKTSTTPYKPNKDL